jgi:FkbM family methyltransferase
VIETTTKRLARAAGFAVSRLRNQPWGVSKYADFAALCPMPEVIFDVGANEGQTVTELREVTREATIYAFEPVPAAFAALYASTQRDQRTEPVNVALGAKRGEAKITVDGTSGQNTLNTGAKPSAPTTKVRVRTIDAFCADKKIDRIDLLKIDTEGFESEVLEGAKRMLANGAIRFVLAECEFVHRPPEPHGDFFDIFRRLHEAGMRIVAFYAGGVDGEGWRWGDVLFMQPGANRGVSCSPFA